MATDLSRPSATLPYEGRDQATNVATGHVAVSCMAAPIHLNPPFLSTFTFLALSNDAQVR